MHARSSRVLAQTKPIISLFIFWLGQMVHRSVVTGLPHISCSLCNAGHLCRRRSNSSDHAGRFIEVPCAKSEFFGLSGLIQVCSAPFEKTVSSVCRWTDKSMLRISPSFPRSRLTPNVSRHTDLRGGQLSLRNQALLFSFFGLMCDLVMVLRCNLVIIPKCHVASRGGHATRGATFS